MMRVSIIALLFIAYCPLFAQQPVSLARQQSWQALVYRIPADTLAKYVDYQVTYPRQYLQQKPFMTVWLDSLDQPALPVGNYVIISVKGDQLVTEVYSRSNLQVLSVNNSRRVQLEVKDRTGHLLDNAAVWVNKKQIQYSHETKSYWVTDRKPDDAILKIAVPGDTLIMRLSRDDYNAKGGWSQWWTNFGYTGVGRVVKWPITKIKGLFDGERGYRRRRSANADATGYILFNKPQYKPRDTVRFKAYVIKRKGNRYTENLTIQLQDGHLGKKYQLGTVKPVTPGAYVHEFILDDSLKSDQTYYLYLLDKDERNVLNERFRIEDYLLDEVATYSLKSDKEVYTRRDTMVLTATAKDANGLPVMDGKVKLYALTGRITAFHKDRVYVQDTLWQDEKILAIEGDTKFEIPAINFPAADLSLTIKAEFLNSNNELQAEEKSVEFLHDQLAIVAKQEKAYIKVNLVVNGKYGGKGWMKKSNIEKPVPVNFPYTEKIDPFTRSYYFFIQDDTGRTILTKAVAIESYFIGSSTINNKDTAGVILYNPHKIPVHYTVTYGNRVIAKGGDSTENIVWKDVMPLNKAYKMEWQYIWQGSERVDSEEFGVLDKSMDATIESASTIYPGQTDTVSVSIKDYKGRPAEDVNLSAVSYNSQFGSAIDFPDPPHLEKYKRKRGIRQFKYEVNKTGFVNNYTLGNHQGWREKFGLDTMTYYRLLFPKDSFYVAYTAISNFYPQLSVIVIKGGLPQRVSILYINREPVYYDAMTDQSSYAFKAMPGYAQVMIRLHDRLLEIDSIYLKPYYKHDISFDLDNLPARTIVHAKPTWYTSEEKQMIATTTWQFESDNYYDNSWIWQGDKVVPIRSGRFHNIGPFVPGDSMQYFKPGSFDLAFNFEPGYNYSLSPKMARLERSDFYKSKKKARLYSWQKEMIVGDTLISQPVIEYKQRTVLLLRTTNGPFIPLDSKYGKIKIELPKDSSFSYVVFHRLDGNRDTSVLMNPARSYSNILPAGLFEIVFVTPNSSVIIYDNILVRAGETYCIRNSQPVFAHSNDLIRKLASDYFNELIHKEKEYEVLRDSLFTSQGMPLLSGMAGIRGKVVTAKGENVVSASVFLKGYKQSTLTGQKGEFSFDNMYPGRYTLVVSSVGFIPTEVHVYAGASHSLVNITLQENAKSLESVVVVGYGSKRRTTMRSALPERSRKAKPLWWLNPLDYDGDGELTRYDTTRSADWYVHGKVVQMRNPRFSHDLSSDLRIRGYTSPDSEPLYIIDGVAVDQLPDGLELSSTQVSILSDKAASAIYGSRAANGVIMITTGRFMGKEIRDDFRDYAFWQPNFFTDNNGNAKFTVTYPDNITSWQTYVIGMDKKNRYTTAKSQVKSFKPLIAQVATPQFLIEGDSTALIGKTTNYSSSASSVRNEFTINGQKREATNKEVQASSSNTEEIWISANSTDTLAVQYSVVNTTGFKDGELKRIPVFRKGIEETIGNFWILEKDTTVSFTPDKNAGTITIHAQNNTLEVLLDELKHLRKYPYYCMEQIASKLTGLVMEKKIREAMKQPFKNERELQSLLSRLQKAQLFDGGWSWWPGGKANLTVSNYVTRALLTVRDYPLVETNIRNALLYLHSTLSSADRHEILSVLFTLSEANHMMDYVPYLGLLSFDSLSVHDQWQYIKIKQNAKLDYNKELSKVMQKQISTMLGGLHWGEDNYWWDRNMIATTVLAYKTLEKDKDRQTELKRMTQFFLERRKKGHWTNTVESASIVSTILPAILSNQSSFTAPASLRINNSVTTSSFPFTTTVTSLDAVTINKTGGGLLYCTAYQEIFNKDPLPVTDKFRITTSFERSGSNIASLKAGEKVLMKINVEVTADADYVQIEIPIPAGCTYGIKKQNHTNTYTEYLKNKTVFFIEKLAKGKYQYEIELEPRYTGSYTLNPAKAELMYFPVFFGRNETKRISVKK